MEAPSRCAACPPVKAKGPMPSIPALASPAQRKNEIRPAFCATLAAGAPMSKSQSTKTTLAPSSMTIWPALTPSSRSDFESA